MQLLYCDQPSSFSQAPSACGVQCSTECLVALCGDIYTLLDEKLIGQGTENTIHSSYNKVSYDLFLRSIVSSQKCIFLYFILVMYFKFLCPLISPPTPPPPPNPNWECHCTSLLHISVSKMGSKLLCELTFID